VKKLTGDRRMRAKLMRQDHFEFDLTATLVLVTNHKPRIVGTDSGIWSRVHLTPWQVFIPPDERDTGLPGRLIDTESDGVLAWLVEGHRAYRERGLAPPKAVTEATDAYRAEQDPVGGWIDDRCDLVPAAETASKALRASYEAWCVEQGSRPVHRERFADALRSHECAETRSKRERFWKGVRLRRNPENAVPTGDSGGRVTLGDSDSGSPLPRERGEGNRETPSPKVTPDDSRAPDTPVESAQSERRFDLDPSGAESTAEAPVPEHGDLPPDQGGEIEC